jgi:signal transduction histidine kinase/uncharacterized membrane protein YagU involved in acid resistance
VRGGRVTDRRRQSVVFYRWLSMRESMPPRDSTHALTLSGLAVAAVGFALTRYTVLESLRPDASLAVFLIREAPVLVAGFGLTAFGVGLTISSRARWEVRRIAGWCLLGTAGMVLVVALTYAATPLQAVSPQEFRLIANAFVGGALGGTLLGVRSVSLRRHRRGMRRKTDQLTVLNRLLRHELLNKLNVIKGHATAGEESTDGGTRIESWDVVRRNAEAIDEAIEVVGVLTDDGEPRPVSLREHVETAVAAVRHDHPGASVDVDGLSGTEVCGSAHLHVLFERLIEHAVVHDDDPSPTVRVTVDAADRDAVSIRIVGDGPALPAVQQRLVRERVVPESDDPRSGFGLQIANLIVDDVDGDLTVETPVADGRGTALTVRLRRAAAATDQFQITADRLWRGTAAGLVAGVAMGLVTQFVTGNMSVIGVLYGAANVGIGWVTHLYHSVFFALLFVAATVPWVRDDDWRRLVSFGAVYGAILWLVAASVVMPLWLRSVGVATPVPNVRLPSLLNHLLWGGVFGATYAWLLARLSRRG